MMARYLTLTDCDMSLQLATRLFPMRADIVDQAVMIGLAALDRTEQQWRVYASDLA